MLHAGKADYNSTAGVYTVSGSGENIWFGKDAFHFVWKKMEGDVAVEANIAFVGTTGNNHRKAALLIRQTLEPASIYVDVAQHGDGLTSLQYRDAKGADTHKVESNVSAPQRVRIEKRGQYAYVYVSDASGRLTPSGAAMRVPFQGLFYVGLGVCSHDKDVTETALFSNVHVEPVASAASEPVLYSTLETVKIASTDRRVAMVAAERFEAPNWSSDGTIFYNQGGTIRRMARGSTTSTIVATGSQVRCNNDHGLSPDGRLLAISDQSSADGGRGSPSFLWRVGRRWLSRRTGLPTGMGGRPTARRWPSPGNAPVSLISTPSPRRVGRRSVSRRLRALTTARTTRRTGG